MNQEEPKKTKKLPIKMTEEMKEDLEMIGKEMEDRSMAWVGRKFIAEGIAKWKKRKHKKTK